MGVLIDNKELKWMELNSIALLKVIVLDHQESIANRYATIYCYNFTSIETVFSLFRKAEPYKTSSINIERHTRGKIE
jgi:hypothetical protein